MLPPVATLRIFIWGYSPRVWGTEVPQSGSRGKASIAAVWVSQNLKQLADIVYIF